MFGTVKRIIDWCGSFKKNLYIGFIFSFFSGWFAAMPVIWAAYNREACRMRRTGESCLNGLDWKKYRDSVVLYFSALSV